MNTENENIQELDDSIDTQDDAGMEPGTPEQVHEPDDYEIKGDKDSAEPDVQRPEDAESADLEAEEAPEQDEGRPHGQTVPLRAHEKLRQRAQRAEAERDRLRETLGDPRTPGNLARIMGIGGKAISRICRLWRRRHTGTCMIVMK